jgi:ferrous iron transport protein A
MTDAIDAGTQFPLGQAKRGYSGVIRRIDADATVGRDPIAVRVENVTIAVRRREAMAIIVG